MKMYHWIYRFCRSIPILVLVLFLTGCQKEQQLANPSGIQVSQGTYLGVVHLSWSQSPEAQYYNVERQDVQTGDWLSAGTTSNTVFDDYGFNLPDNKITYGHHYRYRVSAGSSDNTDSPFIEADQEGWTYDPQKVVVTATIEQNGNVTVSWTETNPLDQLDNFMFAQYVVMRKSGTNPDFVNVTTVNDDTTYLDTNPGDNPEYEVEATYHYTYQNMDYGTFDGVTGMLISESVAAMGGGTGTLTFTRTDMGTVSSSNGISFVEMKTYAGTQYLGMVKDADAAEKGVPGIYMLNGTAWQEMAAPYPDDLMNETSLGYMDFAVEGNNIYLAGLSYDSLYVFEYNGTSWSTNMTMNNMGLDGSPSSMATEVIDGSLYLAVTLPPDYDLKVLKWTGSDWAADGGDANGWIETGKDIFNLGLQNIGGTLYLSYTTKNSEYNATVNIKHLNNNSWNTDLTWTADNILGLKLAGNGSSLCFLTTTQQQSVYPGGVYKVTSTTTVEDLITASDSWFMGPYTLTVDLNGEVFIVSYKLVSATEAYPAIYNYNGNLWSALSGDFSDGTDPVAIHADGTTIYYVYGDGSNLTTWYAPKSLKSAKFTP